MELTRNLIDKRGKLLVAKLVKNNGCQSWEFQLLVGKGGGHYHRDWIAQGLDAQSIQDVVSDVWHSLALALVVAHEEDLFPEAVRGIRAMIVDCEARKEEADRGSVHDVAGDFGYDDDFPE